MIATLFKNMEQYLKISYLNDFIFCPLSIYYHQLYGELSEKLYYGSKQLDGKAAHQSIDEQNYSTHKNMLQSIDIFSHEYNLCGKIDLFDITTGTLIERKKHIDKIYDGYIFQLYAQYFCLTEMGFSVLHLKFYSFDDNKSYAIALPQEDSSMFKKFIDTNNQLQDFEVNNFTPHNVQKCKKCIYNDFCDRALAPKDYHGGY